MRQYSIFTSCAGHSAKSPGACTATHKEYEQNRLNNKAFIQAMNARGYAVTDTTSDESTANAVLREQVKKANKVGGGVHQLDVSFHMNATPGATGVEVCYVTSAGKEMAEKVAKAIHEATGLRNRGAKKRSDLYFLNATFATAILIEVGFIDNKNDMAIIEKHRAKIADAIASAVTGKETANASDASATPKKSSYTGPSVVEYLDSIGISSSFSNRAYLAFSYGIVKSADAYTGSAAQNTALLNRLRGN